MALNIKLNLEDRYEVYHINNQIFSVFDSELTSGEMIQLGIKISADEHPLMPDVYNLAFGPINEKNEIDDQAKLTHLKHSKVFSTIIFESLSFLTQNPRNFLGIDGSNTARAYMYYRCIQNNFDYLTTIFNIYGVNYYTRLLRDNHHTYDLSDYVIIPALIGKGENVKSEKLYNYFIFNSKPQLKLIK